MVHSPRNRIVTPGVWRFSRSAMYKRRALYKRTKATPTKKTVEEQPTTKKVVVGGASNGQHRNVALDKAPRWYPAEDVARPVKVRKTQRPTRLRSSIKPGTVLILLAGRFRGKRVVFLKQLASGLLLVTGPFKVNGVPLRRVNQAYVIATSTQISLQGVDVSKFDDAYFAREKKQKAKKSEEDFFGNHLQKKKIDEHRVADQKAVDAALVKALSADSMLKSYMAASFSLTKGQFPHMMKF